ncbi:bifunctional UDP-N-acetylglucosamine diphosphorylase/glucosamine-1-phosphate N-acetyltransferase GlmU [Salsipaludibacter albus]|uniref:bifunctional UDP-N-acetylglucosamine diphosphorylase/glucosamine-1-phosphate N-acetyltransferase GlmU n=1 Tax=Salsipaludibacter albus TaxID=2849650 RepID=UPI001EE4144E|nr:bifunctional UDP-N-acetylglucosamine diphosphorylase/glucosamine-1-phosphate N-acetyltransferase GlmU [Salsipaludibacter albus]MBY5161941.1 bifunctional UDP-N-acetylglucosamine diphosphorylase/glucosamine-1-phosphate N-acetyltransferase GlmU [Salsipaludibacter albus]
MSADLPPDQPPEPTGDPSADGPPRGHVAAIVMAAGKGTRLRSDTAKVLHPVAGRSLLHHVLGVLAPLGLGRIVVVVGHQADDVAAHARDSGLDNVVTVVQQPQHGTGHAVEVGLSAIDAADKVLVVNGDAPLLTAATLARLADQPVGTSAILSTELDDPTGYGRIVRDADGAVLGVVEERDCTEEERAIRSVNGGMYVFDHDGLADRVAAIGTDNEQGERYVTDLVGLLVAERREVRVVTAPAVELTGVNDRAQLARAGQALRRRHLDEMMASGVTVMDPEATWIDVTVDVEPDATILPGCLLTGATHVAAGAVVGPHTELHDTEVAAGARVRQSVCDTVAIGPDAQVGPFAHLRPGTELGPHGKVGAFAETKNATIGARSKVPHLSYVGDATLGEDVNFSCGAVTVNYDGFDKHHTTVEDGAFVGCDTMLVAPVTVGTGAFVAAGSTVTEDVPPGALAIARARQTVKEGWADQRRAEHDAD